MDNKKTSIFAARLRALRRGVHMTQEDVANYLNLHRTTYTKYETDKANPDQTCLIQLAQLFHVSVDFLVGNEDTVPAMQADLAADAPELRLNVQEISVISDFRHLDTDQQKQLIKILHDMKKENRPV